MAFVFMGLLEFAIVNSYVRKAMKNQEAAKNSIASNIEEKFSEKTKKMKMSENSGTAENSGKTTEPLLGPENLEKNSPEFIHYMTLKKVYWRRASLIDFLSRIFFPASFLVFNLFYWFYYYFFQINWKFFLNFKFFANFISFFSYLDAKTKKFLVFSNFCKIFSRLKWNLNWDWK